MHSFAPRSSTCRAQVRSASAAALFCAAFLRPDAFLLLSVSCGSSVLDDMLDAASACYHDDTSGFDFPRFVNARNDGGMTVLHIAAAAYNLTACKRLALHDASMYLLDDGGRSVLHAIASAVEAPPDANIRNGICRAPNHTHATRTTLLQRSLTVRTLLQVKP